ncbi:MAG: hypothetical protein IMW98_04530 [Firmicutes bacterium]|nr:hypothetical protein [Bacillota bacterium]
MYPLTSFELSRDRQQALRREAERTRLPRERQRLFELELRVRRAGQAFAAYRWPPRAAR